MSNAKEKDASAPALASESYEKRTAFFAGLGIYGAKIAVTPVKLSPEYVGFGVHGVNPAGRILVKAYVDVIKEFIQDHMNAIELGASQGYDPRSGANVASHITAWLHRAGVNGIAVSDREFDSLDDYVRERGVDAHMAYLPRMSDN